MSFVQLANCAMSLSNVAMDPAEVLQQAGVSVSREFDFGPALPFTMGTVGSDSESQDCASPTASASGLMGTIDCLASVIT